MFCPPRRIVGTLCRGRTTQYRPRLERLEPRLPPGDILSGSLFMSALAISLTSPNEFPGHDRPRKVQEIGDEVNTGAAPRRAMRCKDVSAPAVIELIEGDPVQRTTPASPAEKPAMPERFETLSAAPTSHPVSAQTLLITSPGAQALGAAHPAFSGADLATRMVAIGRPRAPTTADEAHKSKTFDNYGKLPLTFEANHGQTDSRVDFIARTGDGTVFLTPTAAVFAKTTPEDDGLLPTQDWRSLRSPPLPSENSGAGVAVHMQLVGANPNAAPLAQERRPGIVNYFIGNDPSHWHGNIPTFARVEYKDVYPGIDIVYHGNNGRLEYDFVVSPGADPTRIRMAFSGSDQVAVDTSGDLILTTGVQTLRQHKPVVYQEKGGARHEVVGGFQLRGAEVGFTLGDYDRSRHLIIDPVVRYSTYMGGTGDDRAWSVAVDANGSAYLAGATASVNFPTTPGAFQLTFGGGAWDACVTKLSADGTSLVYSTYLGGQGAEYNPLGAGGTWLAVDHGGNAFVTGATKSTDFPITPGAFQQKLAGDFDAYVTQLDPTGSVLVYSTYIGGTGRDETQTIALGSDGDVYVAGYTESTNFPTQTGAFQKNFGGGADAFVVQVGPGGTALKYATYLGGTGIDSATALAIDPRGNAYVAGETTSSNYPTTPGAFQTYSGGPWDGFVTKLSPRGSALAYSTCLGGAGYDAAFGIAIDAKGDAFVTGITRSTNFPTTPGVFQATYGGGGDAFVTELAAGGGSLVYSTYLGGEDAENDGGITGPVAVNAAGVAFVGGSTSSANFPVTPDAIQPQYGGETDSMLAIIAPGATALLYSTYLGGSNEDIGFSIALSGLGNIYVTGRTESTNFPITAGAFQGTNAGGRDVFVTKFTRR